MCCRVSLSYSWTFFLLVSSLNLVRLLKIPFFLLSSYRYGPVYHQGPVVRVSYVCTCCIFSYIRRYSSLSFLGVIISWLGPALSRHIIRTPWSISCEGGRWDPKNDRGVGSFRIVGGTAKGPWVCFKRTSRSLFGGWERGKLETPSFLWMIFCFWDWFNMFCLFSLHSVRKSLFSNSLLRLHWSWPTRVTLWLFNKFKMKQGRKHIFF